MTTREQNEFLTRTGPARRWATCSGATGFRRCWRTEIPSRIARRCASSCCRERLLAFRDTQGPRRPDGRILRASRRVAVVRAQRGERAALPLSRLEIRRDRPMHRGALGAGGERLLPEDQAQVLSVRRAGRRDLGLHGPARIEAAAAGFRMGEGAACAPLRLQAHAGVQLSAGDGGRHRFRATSRSCTATICAATRSTSARAPSSRARPTRASKWSRPRAAWSSACADRRRRATLLAHHAMDHAVPHA